MKDFKTWRCEKALLLNYTSVLFIVFDFRRTRLGCLSYKIYVVEKHILGEKSQLSHLCGGDLSLWRVQMLRNVDGCEAPVPCGNTVVLLLFRVGLMLSRGPRVGASQCGPAHVPSTGAQGSCLCPQFCHWSPVWPQEVMHPLLRAVPATKVEVQSIPHLVARVSPRSKILCVLSDMGM